MIYDILNIDPEICTTKLRMALEMCIMQSESNRYEFITPEVLLYNIAKQPEFIRHGRNEGIDMQSFLGELKEYNSLQDIQPEDVEYQGLASCAMMALVSSIKYLWEERKKSVEGNGMVMCINIPDVIYRYYEFDDNSMAKFLLLKYLGERHSGWLLSLSKTYCKDSNEYLSFEEMGKGCGFDDNDDIGDFSRQEFLSKMMEETNRLIDTINSIEADKEERQSHEPWEDLVVCLNKTYRKRNPLIGREKELSRCVRILCRKDKNNPLFIGEPGVGKTALIYGLTRMIEEGNVPDWLKGQRIYALDMASLVAGASYHGEFEKRVKLVLDGALRRKNCIIYIDDIHTICSSGGNNSMNAADILKPYLEDGGLRFIGTTTYQDFNKSMANQKAITRRFGQIDIKEPSKEECIEIINGLLPVYEKHHGVKYKEDAVTYAVEQADTLIHDRYLPDKALDIVDEAGAFLRQNPLLNKLGEPKPRHLQKVDKGVIKRILTDVCRIDAKVLASESNSDLRTLGKRISAEIYGQDEAINKTVGAVMMSKAGLMEPDKPIASLLFVGPTGVGKTEVCKMLAKEMGIKLIRFDMSEYTEKHTISKLIGSPAGYVGYDEGGLLTDAIRQSPNCILLLDEIEKAHSDIYNILLQVMDYASLSDNKGKKADFRNVILVMTSNAGAQYADRASIGFGGGQSRGEAMLGSVKKTFKPEFINRLSGIVVFNDMDSTMAGLILDKKLKQLSQRLEARGFTMSLSDEARKLLLEKGFSRQYGAREMDRAIQQYLTPLLMERILFGKTSKDRNIKITCKDNGLATD